MFEYNFLKIKMENYSFLKYVLLIMLSQLSHFFSSPLSPSVLHTPFHQHSLPLSSCPWVLHTSSLASPFPILFLPSLYFVLTIYASYSLYLFPHSSPSLSPQITFHVIDISVILFLF